MLILSYRRLNRAIKFIINLITRECCIQTDRKTLDKGVLFCILSACYKPAIAALSCFGF
ncbi:hypothetical protein M2408_001953 [Sphingobacterium sp. BIGb0165]|nr:hypothetical protein [Sphingobacterium sp. BIGb0165]